MKKQLIKRTEEIQDQTQEHYTEKIIESFESDIELYHEFINKLNIYERFTVNDWSDDRDKIEILEYLNICKDRLESGLPQHVAVRLLKLMHDVCEWSHMRVRPVLLEQSHKLEEVNSILKDNNERYEEQLEEYNDLLLEAQEELNKYEQLKKDHDELKEMFTEVFDYAVKLENNESFEEDDEIELQNKVRKYLNTEIYEDDEEETEIVEEQTIETVKPKPQKSEPGSNKLVEDKKKPKPRIDLLKPVK